MSYILFIIRFIKNHIPSLTLLSFFIFSACSNAPISKSKISTPAEKTLTLSKIDAKLHVLNTTVKTLSEKIHYLQKKTATLDQSLQSFLKTKAFSSKRRPSSLSLLSPKRLGAPTSTYAKRNTQGFLSDRAMALFRNGWLLFLSKKYSEAILEWTSILKNFPDHPVGEKAQFYIAESYFQEGEKKLSLEEFQHFLNLYPYSTYLGKSLARLSQLYFQTGNHLKASHYKNLFLALLPQDPAKKFLPKTIPTTKGSKTNHLKL